MLKDEIKSIAETMVETDCECGADIDSDRTVHRCAWHEVLHLINEDER